MEKKSKASKVHRKNRQNSRVWIFILAGMVLLFLSIILVLLMAGSTIDDSVAVEESTVNVEKDIPETDMGDLVYHEPAAENIVMQGGFGYVNNELLVTLDSADSLPVLKEYLAGVGGEVVGEIPLTADYQIMLSGTYSEEELEAMIEQLKALPYVRRSSLNYAFELENDAISGSSAYYPNDEKWDSWEGTSGNNWNMKAIDAPGAWVYRDQMQPVNVGVIDSIFYPYHEDLKDAFQEMPLGNISAMGPYKYNGLGWWTSEQSHGTHVVGIIGADFDNEKGVCGVAPNAKLYGATYKKGKTGQFYFSQKTALSYLVQIKRCRVLNLSYCLGEHELMYSASKDNQTAQQAFNDLNTDLAEFLGDLEERTGNSFLICKSANNDNDDLFYKKDEEDIKNGVEYFWHEQYKKDSDYNKYKNRFKKDKWVSGGADAKWDIYSGIENPEVKDSIIVVGATAVSGMHSYFGCKHNGYQIAVYSDRGTRVDVLAPGGSNTSAGFSDEQVYSTVADGIVGYGYKAGTSMATPHVAGVAAMIFGIDPTFTAKEVKDIIKSTATGSYGEEGYKMLNAKLAVEKAIELRDQKVKENSVAEPTDRHKYEIFRDTLTWEEAKAACEAKGGHLATITSQEEQKLIESLNTQNSKLWIGGYKNSAGEWCWVTGEPWEYQNWGEGEPNNSSNVVADESCVAVWPVKWNDLANSNTYEQSGYICEWEASNAAEETQVEGYTGHLYEFYTLPESEWESGPITWQQAERRCEWKGGHLAVIESSTENFLLYSAMKAKGYENAYFGFSDESSEGNWKWVDGTSTAYTNWHSGEPNNQDGIEHYAMFYEKFQDGTWNDADGIIDAGCAYICEWDDSADQQLSSDSFTERQLRIIAKDLGVPDNLNVDIKQYPKTYWEAAGLWDIYVEITLNGKVIASGSFDVETGEMGRNLYIYSH